MRAACAILMVLVTTGCALKAPPPHDSTVRDALPNLQVPQKWAEAGDPAKVGDGWLAEFHDPQLEALVPALVGAEAR